MRALAMATAALALAVARPVAAQPAVPPAPTRWVTDEPGLLTPATRRALDGRLERYERRTGRQVLVWIGRSTGGVPVEDWSVRAFEAWGVGRRGVDEGLVLFLFAEDRTARIEVGYGLEAQVPDARAARVLREVTLPRLRAGDPDAAVTGTVERVLSLLGDPESRAPARERPFRIPWDDPARMILGGILLVGFLVLLVTHPALALYLLTVVLSGGRRGGNGGDGGGGFGGGGGRSGGGGAGGRW